MDKLFKDKDQISYYTQRNNWIYPSATCFPTSVAMAMMNNGLRKWAKTLPSFCQDDLFTAMANTKGIGVAIAERKFPEVLKWNVALNQVWAVMQDVAIWFLETEYGDSADAFVKWKENAKLDDIKAEIDKGYMVVMGTTLTGSGHVVCVAGYNDKGGLILCDPWGNPNNYKGDANGHLVTVGKESYPRLVVGSPHRVMFIHSDLQNPMA